VIWRVIGLLTLAALAAAEAVVRVLHAFPSTAWVSRPVVYWPALVLDALVLVAMLERRFPLFGRVFWRGPGRRPLVAITFDDGPTERDTPRILDVLRDKGVKATFFVIGQLAEARPSVVARAAAEGHEVGNHGYDHEVLPLRGPWFIRRQIERTSAVIEQACGRRPTLFRASHGWRNPWVGREAARAGCATVGWTLGVWDTDRPGADEIRRRVERGVEPGCVLLLHDGRGLEPDADASQVVEALPGIIDLLRRNGYRMVSISEMMREATGETA
jgi:peptidoglycan/xylan/chitin deacetylase (PgdA/CDA1 family)